MIHQLNDISELAGASMPTVKEGVQDERREESDARESQDSLDLTNKTLLSVLPVGVK